MAGEPDMDEWAKMALAVDNATEVYIYLWIHVYVYVYSCVCIYTNA
jgi:hypothetical protein